MPRANHHAPGQLPKLDDEAYAKMKEDFPKVVFNDEDQTFISKKGNVISATFLRRFKPIPPGGNEVSQKGAKIHSEKAQDGYKKYLLNLQHGLRVSEAAKRAGMTYAAIIHKRERDPEFIELERQAEQIAAEPIENALYDSAVNGNVPAAVKWLEKRAPERWPGDKMIVEAKNTLELDASDRIGNIIALMARLQQRTELTSGDYIDVEAEEPPD